VVADGLTGEDLRPGSGEARRTQRISIRIVVSRVWYSHVGARGVVWTMASTHPLTSRARCSPCRRLQGRIAARGGTGCYPQGFSVCTGGQFAVPWKVPAGATMYGNCAIREPCVAHKSGTPRQGLGCAWACSPHVVARARLIHCPRMSPLSRMTSRGANDGHNASSVHMWMRCRPCKPSFSDVSWWGPTACPWW
jgi:hypothetical protein